MRLLINLWPTLWISDGIHWFPKRTNMLCFVKLDWCIKCHYTSCLLSFIFRRIYVKYIVSKINTNLLLSWEGHWLSLPLLSGNRVSISFPYLAAAFLLDTIFFSKAMIRTLFWAKFMNFTHFPSSVWADIPGAGSNKAFLVIRNKPM